METLPVLDLGAFRSDPGGDEAHAFVADLLRAAHEVGFVYLTGHGVDPALDTAMFATARAFFELPEAERRALAIAHSAAFRGYTVLGDEVTNGHSDWREQLDLGHEQPEPELAPGDPAWLRLRGPNQWPASLPSMAPTVLGWMAEMDTVGLTALRALAVGLGLPIDHWDGGFLPESDVHLKIIHYPPAPPGSAADQGVGLHRDTGLLTFILQDDVGGLQVQVGDRLLDAPTVPGAYLMNLGEMLETATDGYLKATPHRVVSPPDGRDRISIAYFFNPRFELPFERVELPPELAAVAPGAAHDGVGLRVFGENNLKTRLRSHPDVARRHYADVGQQPTGD
ncbi:MAG: 2-oxoglutarate and iron-dependent oxygenase domain-containing protein [Actinomycetota bacterium]